MKNLKNLFSVVLLLTGVALLLIPGPGGISRAETIVVNKLEVAAADGSPIGFFDANSSDGICADATGGCNLLAALGHSINTAGPDTIVFSVSGTIINSNFTITQDGTIIDGTMSDIVLEGKLSSRIITIQSNSNVIKGLSFRGHPTGASSYGIEINDGANNIIGGLTPAERNIFTGNSIGIWIHGAGADDNVVIGNYIGVDSTGIVADGNGIGVNVALGAERNRIGGTTPAERNIISGNQNRGVNVGPSGNNNVIIGNYIGVDATGSIAISNTIGVFINGGSNNRIGGTTAAERNIISGNLLRGLYISNEQSVVVVGNYIGTDVSGTVAIPNGTGIFVSTANNTTIGGALTGEGNVISGNSLYGVYLSADSCKFIGNYIGTDATGSQPLGNDSVGIYFEWGADFNTIGGNSVAEGNRIAYNGFGLQIRSPDLFFGGPTHYNTIRFNSFFDNIGAGIKFTGLTTQDDIVPPTITAATPSEISGTSVPLATIDIYIADGIISDSAEGETYVATGTSDGTGAFTISLSGVTVNDRLTATVTDSLGNTSEFSVSVVALLTFPPILATIGSQSVNENVNLNFGVSATDADGTTPALPVSNLPAGATFVDNGNGTGFFDWTPDFTQAGSYSVTFYASDGTAVDSEVVTIVVNNVNQLPVIDPLLDTMTVNEGDSLLFFLFSTDFEDCFFSLQMTSPDLPVAAIFTLDIGECGVGGEFNWLTNFTDAGTYHAIFTATDDSGGVATDSVIIIVNDVPCPDLVVTSLTLDGPPNAASIGRPIGYRLHITVQNIGDAISSPVTAGIFISDDTSIGQPDSILPGGVISIGALQPGETFILPIDSLMPLSSVPSAFFPASVYLGVNIDYLGILPECNELNNTALRFLRVDRNLLPIFDSIADMTVNEGELISFPVTAIDWDLDSLTLSMFGEGVPDSEFVDNGDGTGTFNWTPTFNQAGTYLVEFYASDEPFSFGFIDMTITVNDVIQLPVFDSLPDTMFVNEGENLSFFVSASDFEDFCLSIDLTSPDLPLQDITFINGGECGELMDFNWLTNFTDAGTYTANFTVRDSDGGADSTSVIIVVNDVNRPPVINPIGNRTVSEGDTLTFNVSSSDPDGETPFMTMSSPDLPPEATFQISAIIVAPGIYTFDWPTDFFDAGTYTAIFTASDGVGGVDEDTISILVFNVNQQPILDPISDTTIDEGQSLVLSLSGFDPDSTEVFFGFANEPIGSELIDNGNGTATFSWTPTFDDAGIYDIFFLLNGIGEEDDNQTVRITVNNVNQLPVIDTLLDTMTISEGDSISFIVYAEDLEDCRFSLQMTSPDLPAEALFSVVGTECGEARNFDWQPNFTDAGTYRAIFTATDNDGGVDIDSVIIVVNDVNQPVSLQVSGFTEIGEGDTLALAITTTDLDNDNITISYSSSDLPPEAVFTDSGNGNASLVWPTNFFDAGSYTAFISADDGNGSVVGDSIFVSVSNRNQQPILNPINDTSIVEGQSLVLALSGFDPDSTEVFFFVSGKPLGSDLVDNGDGTALFSWTPTFSDAGTYDFEFLLFGVGKEGTSDSIRITVENFNRLPSFDQIPDTIVVDENSFTSFDVLAVDPDDEDCISLSLSSPNLPEQAIFVYDGDCLYFGRFEWNTTYDDAGIYQAVFAVDDGLLGHAEDTVIIIVNNKNQPPRFEFIKFEETNEGVNLNFLIIATDGDSTIPDIKPISPLPPGALYSDNRNGSGLFDWTPDFNQNGEYLITFVATDDSSATDTMDVLISVNEAGDAELTVKSATCVQCSPPQNFTDIIVTERRFGIEFNSLIDTSTLKGNINFASASGQTFDYFFDEYTKLLYVYPFSKSEPFQPADTITVFLSTGIVDLSESPLDSNYSLTYFTGPVIYPGDADNNGIVDERDILSLGLYWNLTGPARELVGEVGPLEFVPSPGHFQVLSEKWEPNLAAYADADGSGTVNADDICGVSFNFGLSNQPAQKNNGDMPAMKQLDNSIMQQLYNALIECPNSAGKIHLIEFLENAINSQSVILPTEVELYQNYPNPFNPSTTIEFYLPEQQYVTLDIYNILGQRVVSLVDRDMDAGFQSVNWSGRDNSGSEIASGIYFYLLQTDDRKISKRMMMLK